MSRKRMLYRYEFQTVKWFLMAGLFLCGLVLLAMDSVFSSENWGWVSYGSGTQFFFSGDFLGFGGVLVQALQVCTLPAILFLGGMTAYQFSDSHKRNKREFISSLPYTQQERFLAKVLVGIGTITMLCLVFGIGVFVMRACHYLIMIRSSLVYPEYKLLMANDTWFHTLRTLALLWFIMLAAYALYVLVNSLVIHGIAAALVGVGTMLAPSWIAYQICGYVEYLNAEMLFSPNQWLLNHPTICRMCRLFRGGGYCREHFGVGLEQYGDTVEGINFTLIDYCSSGKVIALTIALALACFALAWFVNIRQDGARFGRVVPLKWVRKILSAGMAVCFGTGFSWIFIYILRLENAAMVCSVCAVVCIGLFLLIDKILRRAVR